MVGGLWRIATLRRNCWRFSVMVFKYWRKGLLHEIPPALDLKCVAMRIRIMIIKALCFFASYTIQPSKNILGIDVT